MYVTIKEKALVCFRGESWVIMVTHLIFINNCGFFFPVLFMLTQEEMSEFPGKGNSNPSQEAGVWLTTHTTGYHLSYNLNINIEGDRQVYPDMEY